MGEQDDRLEITAADLYALVRPVYRTNNDEISIHDRCADEVTAYGMTINGVETRDPDYVVGTIELASLKIGKREIDLDCE